MFISIRWKASILLSVILLFITIVWVSRSIYHDLETYRDAINKDQVRYQNTLDQLINDNFLKLSQYAQLVGDYPFIKQANLEERQASLKEQLASKWFDLNLNIGIDFIAVIDSDGKRVLGSYHFKNEASLQRFKSSINILSPDLNDGSVRSYVYCDNQCSQVVTEPFFFEDGEKGYIILSQNMSELVARYHSISVSNIAVMIRRSPEEASASYIENWKGMLWAASDFEKTLNLLQNFSKENTDVQNIYFEDSLWNMWQSKFRINRLLPRNYIQVGHPAIYINVIDNSKQKELVKANVMNQVLSGLIAWVFAVIVMIMALLGTIQRLLMVVKEMSFLPKQQFNEANEAIGAKDVEIRDEH